jgi:hypothetical protein
MLFGLLTFFTLQYLRMVWAYFDNFHKIINGNLLLIGSPVYRMKDQTLFGPFDSPVPRVCNAHYTYGIVVLRESWISFVMTGFSVY